MVALCVSVPDGQRTLFLSWVRRAGRPHRDPDRWFSTIHSILKQPGHPQAGTGVRVQCLGPPMLLLQVNRDSDVAEVTRSSLLIPPPTPLRSPSPEHAPCEFLLCHCTVCSLISFRGGLLDAWAVPPAFILFVSQNNQVLPLPLAVSSCSSAS